MDQLIRNVRELAAICAPLSSLADLRSPCADNGTSAAVRDHDTPALFDWLADALSYQGVSDAIAERYMDEHGSISFYEVQNGLRQRPSCPRLTSYWQFAECRFAKTAQTCSEPAHLSACPVPRHDLRNGRLNQTAYALFFFLRDVCNGDLVAWFRTFSVCLISASTSSRSRHSGFSSRALSS